MKKLLLLVCAAVMSLSASAQAGDKAVGAQLVFGSETNSIGVGVNIREVDTVRVEETLKKEVVLQRVYLCNS